MLGFVEQEMALTAQTVLRKQRCGRRGRRRGEAGYPGPRKGVMLFFVGFSGPKVLMMIWVILGIILTEVITVPVEIIGTEITFQRGMNWGDTTIYIKCIRLQ